MIERAWARAQLSPGKPAIEVADAVTETISLLDSGKVRVAEKIDGRWITHRVGEEGGPPVLQALRQRGPDGRLHPLLRQGGRPSSLPLPRRIPLGRRARGSAGGGTPRRLHRKNVVLMPSFVNIGAYVDEGTMVDTWATVGSCAQIGSNVHLSGGVGIGGVLEPLQANPTIIEDNCFIGARSEIVEGVIVEEGSVVSMGVFIGASTRIYRRDTGETLYGRVPAGSVVVPGSLPSSADASAASIARSS
jgi:2,3,4,5-tetrahydropyridine-2,6-dicarboxylate N-succinyltransferase